MKNINLESIKPDELVTDKNLRDFVGVKCFGDKENLLQDSYLFNSWKDGNPRFIPSLNLTTISELGKFLNVERTVISEHVRNSEKQQELKEAGMKPYTSSQILEMMRDKNKLDDNISVIQQDDVTQGIQNKSMGDKNKLIGTLGTNQKDDVTQGLENNQYEIISNGSNKGIKLSDDYIINLNNRNSWYLTPEAFAKLCFLMTGTEKAKQFRTKAIEAIKLQTQNLRTIEKLEDSLEDLKKQLLNKNVSIDSIEVMLNEIKQAKEKNKDEYYQNVKNDLRFSIDKLNSRFIELEHLSRNTEEFSGSDIKKFKREAIKVNSRISELRLIVDDIIDEYEEYQQNQRKFLGNMKQGESKNLSDIFMSKYNLNQVDARRKVTDFKNKLVDLGIFNVTTFTQKSKDETKNPKKTKLYIPTEKFEWINPAICFISSTKQAQTFKLNRYGEIWLDVVMKYLDEDETKLSDMTEVDFELEICKNFLNEDLIA